MRKTIDRIALATAIPASVAVIVGIVLDIRGHPESKVLLGTAFAVAALGAAGGGAIRRDLGLVGIGFLVASLSLARFTEASGGATRVALYSADVIALVAGCALLGLSLYRMKKGRCASAGSDSETPAPVDCDRSR